MTERDKIRICKALAKRLANIDLKANDIQIDNIDCALVVNREGFKQQKLLDVTFNNGVISFAYLAMFNEFVIYGNLQCLEGTAIISDVSYKVYVNETTQYFDGKPRYITQLYITYTPTDKEPHTEIIF